MSRVAMPKRLAVRTWPYSCITTQQNTAENEDDRIQGGSRPTVHDCRKPKPHEKKECEVDPHLGAGHSSE